MSWGKATVVALYLALASLGRADEFADRLLVAQAAPADTRLAATEAATRPATRQAATGPATKPAAGRPSVEQAKANRDRVYAAAAERYKRTPQGAADEAELQKLQSQMMRLLEAGKDRNEFEKATDLYSKAVIKAARNRVSAASADPECQRATSELIDAEMAAKATSRPSR